MEYHDSGCEAFLYFDIRPHQTATVWLVCCLALIAVGIGVAATR
jgi:uncharacterized membrane protein